MFRSRRQALTLGILGARADQLALQSLVKGQNSFNLHALTKKRGPSM